MVLPAQHGPAECPTDPTGKSVVGVFYEWCLHCPRTPRECSSLLLLTAALTLYFQTETISSAFKSKPVLSTALNIQ